jgi:hypothetical protein
MSVSAVGRPGQVSGRQPHPDRQQTGSGLCGNHRGHGHSSGLRPAAVSGRCHCCLGPSSEAGEHGRCPAGMASRGHAWTDSGPAADAAGQFRCGRPACHQVPDTPWTVCRLRCSPGWRGGYGNWSPGWRPLVGMQPAPVGASQPGGHPATLLAADVGHRRPGERRASSSPRSSTCRPPTSPARQQPTTAWATRSGSTPTAAQVS